MADKEKPTKTTFNDLVAKTYLFDVETPDEETLTFEFRAPTQSEVWAVELDMPPRPEPPMTGFEGSHAEGTLKPVHNTKDQNYQKALGEWVRELQQRKILLCWTEPVPGDTIADKLAALDKLPNWVVSALSRCATMVTMVGQVSITDRPFR